MILLDDECVQVALFNHSEGVMMEDLLPESGAVVHKVQQAHVASTLRHEVVRCERVGGLEGRGAQSGKLEVEQPLLFNNIFIRIKKCFYLSYYQDYIHIGISKPSCFEKCFHHP